MIVEFSCGRDYIGARQLGQALGLFMGENAQKMGILAKRQFSSVIPVKKRLKRQLTHWLHSGSLPPLFGMYAVVQTGGKQYKVTEGDTIEVNRVSGDAGSALTINTVLMVNQDGSVKIGSPTIDGAKVEAEVVKHTRGPKLIIWKMKRRKGYRNKNGHRQDLSVLKINKISA